LWALSPCLAPPPPPPIGVEPNRTSTLPSLTPNRRLVSVFLSSRESMSTIPFSFSATYSFSLGGGSYLSLSFHEVVAHLYCPPSPLHGVMQILCPFFFSIQNTLFPCRRKVVLSGGLAFPSLFPPGDSPLFSFSFEEAEFWVSVRIVEFRGFLFSSLVTGSH